MAVLDCFLVLHTYFYKTDISDLFDFITHGYKKISFYFTVKETKTQFWHKFLHLIFSAFLCCTFLAEKANSEHCCKFLYIFTQYFEFCACFCSTCHLIHLCSGKHSPWRPYSHLMHTLLAHLLLTTHTAILILLSRQFS